MRQCRGTTRKGLQCKNRVMYDKLTGACRYCGIHRFGPVYPRKKES